VLSIYWQGQQLDIGRLVFQRNRDSYDKALSDLANRLRLDVGDDSADPRPGDFWVGCHPRAGRCRSRADRMGQHRRGAPGGGIAQSQRFKRHRRIDTDTSQWTERSLVDRCICSLE
jgi:hypothetical protein